MDDLSRQGKILYWGVSEWSAPQVREAVELCRARGWRPPSSNQPEYNALQRAIEREVLPTTRELGLGNVVWSPLAQGILTGKYRSLADVPEGSRAAGNMRVHAPILARGGSGCRRSSGSTGGEGGVLDVPAGPGVVPAATRGDERHRRRDFHPARRRQRGRCGQADRPRAARGDDPPPGPRPGAAHLTGWKREGRRGNLGKWLAPMLAVRC